MLILSQEEQTQLRIRLDQFLEALPVADIAHEVSALSGLDRDDLLAMLDTYANESRVTLSLISGYLQPDHAMLEVGAGLCLTSLFLKAEGYDITALEPALGGFGIFEQLKEAVLARYQSLGLRVIRESAQQLNTAQHGSFDLIFSNNVVEHIPDWRAALTAMLSVLGRQGMMLHACPNYSVPYEPHYGVPVLRRLPALSWRLFLPADSDPEIWDSLNFISARDVRVFCRQHGLHCRFEKALLYKAMKRLNDDPLFRQRHQGLAMKVAAWVMASGLGECLRYLPPAMSTPMIFAIRKGGV